MFYTVCVLCLIVTSKLFVLSSTVPIKYEQDDLLSCLSQRKKNLNLFRYYVYVLVAESFLSGLRKRFIPSS